MGGYYNPYAEFSKVKDYNFNIDNQAISDRFNKRIASETAARQQAPSQGGGGTNWANVAATTIGQIGGSLATQSTNPYNFSTNNAAPFAGAVQGFAQGGPAGAVVGAIGGLIQGRNSFRRAANNLEAIDPDSNLTSVGPDGRPTFNGGAAIQSTTNMNIINSSLKKKRKGLRGLFASNDDRILESQMAIKSGEINRGLQVGRDKFNGSVIDYNQQQQSMTQYNQLMNNQNRMRNLYSIGTKLY